MSSSAPALCLAVLAGLSPLVVAAEATTARFGAEDVFDLEYASDPQVSPDGRRIVYERRMNDIMTDATVAHLWMVGSDGTGHRPLGAAGGAGGARWSPAGDRIAYLRTEGETTHVMMFYVDSGRSGRIATLRERPASLVWSPDGTTLAFTLPVPAAPAAPLAAPRKPPEGADWAEPVKVFDAVRYKRDGRGLLEVTYTHVFVLPADGGTPRQITSGPFDHEGPLAWSGDGQRIFFSSNRDDDWEYRPVQSDIYSVTVGDGSLRRITSRAGRESSPTVSPDGRRLAYLYDDARKVPYRNRVLHVMELAGGRDVALTAGLDRSVADLHFSNDGAHVYFRYDDAGVRRVARVDLAGQVEEVIAGLGGASLGRPYLSGSFDVTPDGGVVFMYGTALRPADLAVAPPPGADAAGDVRRLTRLNEDLLAHRALGEVHEIRYESDFDGTPIQGWYITPPGYEPGRAYPTVLEIHGGPHLAYGPQFAAELQRYAAAGYVVFYDNHRGSTGYGEAFALLLDGKYSSEEDFADHMSGLDVLIDRGIADPGRLYVTGGSAGGIAAAYAIGLTDRFRAAAVQKPVINWVSKVLTADSYLYQIPYQFPAMPWEDPDHYWKRSPLSLVGNVTTPTLLITGEADQRTPISETEQFYQALKLRRVDAVMVRVPGSPHGIAGKPSRLNAKVDNILAWFARYGGPDPRAGGESASP